MVSVVAAQARRRLKDQTEFRLSSRDEVMAPQGGIISDPDPEPEQQSPGSSSGSASGPGPVFMFPTQQMSSMTQVCDHFPLAQRDQSKHQRYGGVRSLKPG